MSDLSKEEKNILQHLKAGRWNEVEQIAFALEDQKTEFRDNVLKVTRFWQKRLELFVYSGEHTGINLYKEWDHFIQFCCEYHVNHAGIFLAVKSYILKKTIDFLTKASREKDNTSRELLVYLAYAFYDADIIDRAIETLEFILSRFQEENDARVYSLLGDLYAEIYPNPKRDLSVIMFNELFLKCIDTVDINNIEYQDIVKLIQGIRADLFPESEIKYWIPVYGYLYGGLTVRRNLRYEEYKKLQESIALLESHIREQDQTMLLIPQLLNVYFWVFDYYVYQMKTLGGAMQICRRVLELLAMLYHIPGYEESAHKLGLHAEKVLDMLLRTAQNHQ
ncbi:MAG: hypothetical protein ACRC0X_05840 [Brevinema sp.]